MSRPTSKQELLQKACEEFDKMWRLIDSMPDNEKFGVFNLEGKEAHWSRDKSIRDILIHLYEWHQLLLNWTKANLSGTRRPFLPEPYTWKTYGDMNVAFWEKHQSTPYDEAKALLKDSHEKTLALISQFSDQELFTKGFFEWTGTTSLGGYAVSATSSHYDWALKKLLKYKKLLKSK